MQGEGRRALVTGGASGLGAATVRRLLDAGAAAAILDLPSSDGDSMASDLGAFFVACDVTDPDRVSAAVDAAAAALGGLDICVNAAGVANAHRVLTREGTMFPLELFRFVVAVNLIGAFDVTRNAVRHMSENEPNDDGERGVVVNVASIAAFEGQVGQAAYSASKGGIVGMTLPLARDLASIGVRVNAVAPGIMDTPMLAGMPEDVKQQLAAVHVFPRRLGDPVEFAALVQHLVENPLINGEVVRLDAAARMGPR